jgi:type VI secretion system protein ImpM
MRCGLFGKLSAKRDFVAVASPRGFLRRFEPWLEQGLAESRARLPPEDWAAAFRRAPVWRFWLADTLCDKPVLGALAPSMDACGRLYPLILFAVAEGRDSIDPPSRNRHGEWFARAEAFLAACADPAFSFDALARTLDGLEVLHDPAWPDHAGTDRSADAALGFEIARRVEDRTARGLASRSFWWTFAPDAAPSGLHIEADMPDPKCFTQMLNLDKVPGTDPTVAVTS